MPVGIICVTNGLERPAKNRKVMAIIKCPECGHEVSDAADRCPNCGVSIAGNIKTCPDCGRVVLKNAEKCPSCGAKLECFRETSAESLGNGNRQKSYKNIDPYAPGAGEKKKGNKGVIVGIIVAVVVIALGVVAYTLVQKSQKAQNEQDAYEEVIASNDTALYSQYLRDFPDGKHSEEVEAKLKELVAEINDWNDACVNNIKSGFITFLSNHPNSSFEQACKDKIDSLDYVDALSANTVEALQMYVNSHPDGKYVDEAEQAQTNIASMKVQPAEASTIKSVCSQFFTSLANKDEASLTSTVAAVMDNFLNKHNATHSDVIVFANKLTAEMHNAVFTINNDYKIHKVKTDTDAFSFDVTFSVDGNASTHDGQEKMITYFVTARINPDMKISSLNMRRAASNENE